MRKNLFSILVFLSLIFTSCTKKSTGEVNSNNQNNNVVQRVVPLSPAAGEILFAIGAGKQVVAVSQFTDYPPEASELPQVGGFDGKTLSMESILNFKPDLVYISDVMHNFMIPQLESYGIKYYLSKADSVNGVMQEILDIGELTGHSEEAYLVVDEMKKEIEEATSTSSAVNKSKIYSIYWEVWNSPYMSAGSSSFINDVIRCSGGKNIFDDLSEAYPIVSEEAIIKRSPEIILLPASSGVGIDDVCSRNGWEKVSAVVNKRIYVVDDNVFTRPGPRISKVIKEISEMIME